MSSIPTVIDMDTGEALPVAKSSGGSKKSGNFVSNWWNGLSTEQQVGLAGTALTVGVPLLVTGAKKLYAKYKNWRAKKKGVAKTTKPVVNQTNQGRTSINYATGGGSGAIVPYGNFGSDTGMGGYGNPGFADPIIL